MLLLKDQAYENLLNMIQSGEIEYGKIYSLNALSEKMNMSRTPVRDAIQRMCEEGRIDMLPSRGFQLHEMSPEERIQHYHFSNAIEGYCVYTLANAFRSGKGKKHVVSMRRLLTQLGNCLDPKVSFDDFFYCDQQFHLAIINSLEDPWFDDLEHSTMGFYNHPELQYDDSIPRETVYRHHEKILYCIEKGDAAGAYNAMIEHSGMLLEKLL